MDLSQIRDRQLLEMEPEHGMPLLVEDVYMNLVRMRDGGMSKEDALPSFLGATRPGALSDD